MSKEKMSVWRVCVEGVWRVWVCVESVWVCGGCVGVCGCVESV